MSGNFFIDAIIVSLLLGIVGFWWTSVRAKEIALSHARTLCKREGVQLLDYTVALQKIRLSRSSGGSAALRREYKFEFTAEGQHRDQGSVALVGHALANAYLPYKRDADGNRVFIH